MKNVKILGTGCPKCQKLFDLTQKAAEGIDFECQIEKITDIQKISTYGIMITPALVVDGKVKISGKIPSLDELKKMLS
ncbi:MAG: thioredoxin family protein [candidate division Zixibacteria bacterium]|nr:thioredoxin family protein [candidate division Zixibacteria bacterium]